MGWLEAVVVVYLRTAIGLNPAVVIPAPDPATVGTFEIVEIARELATLVMIAAVGWLAGRSALERLAWAAVVFGTWDIIYYAGLRLILGWPAAFDSWDVLFLVPAAWVGPVWAPIAVSAALIGYGLVAARRLRAGGSITLTGWHTGAAVAGGLLVVVSFLVDADRVLRGESTLWSGWPIFVAGMALAIVAASHALMRVSTLVLLIAIVVACGPVASPVSRPTVADTARPTAPTSSATTAATAATSPPVTTAPALTAAASLYAPPRWSRGPDAPIALTEVAATAHDGRVWVAGGLDADGTASDRVLILDPASGTWADGPPLPEAVHHAALVSTGDALFLVGGYRDRFPGPPTSAVRRLDLGAQAWTDATPLPVPRAAGAAAWDGTRILFGGGWSEGGPTDEVLALDAGGWHVVGRLSQAREHLGATSDGAGRTWFLGGRVAGLGTNLGIVDLIDQGDSRPLPAELTPRGGVAGFWHPALGACLAGGEGPGGTNAEVECVDGDRVRALPPLEVPRHGLGAAVISNAIHVVLGGPNPGLFVSASIETLDLTGG